MKKIIVTILFIIFIIPNSSLANSSYSYEPVLRAEQIAIQYWNYPMPCSMPFPIRYSEPILSTFVNAGPEQKSLENKELELVAWAMPNDSTCTIYLNKKIWFPGIKEIIEFHELCDLITHEIGHFLGFTDENQNPFSIKYPLISQKNYNSVFGCIKHSFSIHIIKELEKEILYNQKLLFKK